MITFFAGSPQNEYFNVRVGAGYASWLLSLENIPHDHNAPLGYMDADTLSMVIYSLREYIFGHPEDRRHLDHVWIYGKLSALLGYAVGIGKLIYYG